MRKASHNDGLIPPEDILQGEVEEQFGFPVIQFT